MEHTASVKKKTAHQMLSRKVAVVLRTAEGMGTAVSQVATRRVIQDRPSVLSLVRTESAQYMGVRPTQSEEARSALNIPLTR